MKILTINVPKSFILAIEKLVGDDKNYPSRSELVRFATRLFLIEEMKIAKQVKDASDKEDLVNIPMMDENSFQDFKTYKIKFPERT